ncbi:NRT1/ PTR FAMILY 3.1 [Thalictrum thalictroides]|uniref:NRT1/ PTR FAMILY 3.1 n=1 Tax=Thalictrum thalictroides TaxID=46969 RepID=A0A7J6VZA3_THATH|nr:NRT1/ PTR FAMILY 3.1 [Thalictrum thalictroides]
MSSDGQMEIHNDGGQKRKLGGLRTMPFIFCNEICERFASTGFHANMITYLTQQLNMPLAKASNILTNFTGLASLTPLIGALAADSFAGRFWTISAGSAIYELGLISITISAALPVLHPPPCKNQVNCQEASPWQLAVLYVSLFLTSLGVGGIKPCVVVFGADQLNMSLSKRKTAKWSYFNLYFFALGVATLLALTVVVYVQDHVGWGWGLGIPCIGMGLAIMAFVIGSPLYYKMKPAGSPFTRLSQVVVAAIRKRNAIRPIDSDLLYHNRELDAAIAKDGRLLHTNQIKFLDRAAIITEDEKPDSDSSNLWKLCTVHRVEELKSIIRIIPICSTTILLVSAYSHQQSFSIQQARSMNRHISNNNSFQIPPATMSIFNTLALLIGLVAYERILVPLARRYTKNPSGITCLQRMGIGFVLNILSTLVAAVIEIKRKSVASKHGLLDKPQTMIPISVFWLVPQFSLHGLAEKPASIAIRTQNTNTRRLERTTTLQQMAPPKVLMVAEKPSIALSIASALSGGRMSTRRGSTDVHEFDGTFLGYHAQYRVTSVIGHVFRFSTKVSELGGYRSV